MMEQEKARIKTCLQNEPPFCTAVCPFGLDVRGFIEKMQQGRYNAAFRAYSNAVGFPGIVAHLCDEPCKSACIRGKKRKEGHPDGAIALRLLERAAVDYATRKNPNNYNMPPKNRRIAVIGAGISGLACTLRLCSKKYDVTLYEQSDRIGGHLWGVLPSELFLKEIEHQFMHESYSLVLNRRITASDVSSGGDNNALTIEMLKDTFDAIYIATGRGGDDFDLKEDNGGAFASTEPGIFIGGEVTGEACGSCQAMADGLQAVHAIERYIKVDSMNAPKPDRGTRLRMHLDQIEAVPPVLPGNGEAYTGDEALREAKRCLRCSCDACVRHCDLMYHSKKFPLKIADDVEATIHPGTLAGDGTIATRFIATCTHCGLCKTVCPQGIDMGEFLLQSHRIMTAKGAMPWAFHEFWLRDMAFSNGDDAALILRSKGNKDGEIKFGDVTKWKNPKACDGLAPKENVHYLFFPGCQLGGADPRYVIESYTRLLARDADTALMLHCCGASAEWAGEEALHGEVIATLRHAWRLLGEPTIIFSCPTCKQMFQRYLPEIKGTFLYPMLLEQGVPVRGWEKRDLLPQCRNGGNEKSSADVDGDDAGDGCVVSIFDPCSSRDEPQLQQAVRELTEAAGFTIEPLPLEGKYAQCCSWGGHIFVANPEFTQEVIRSRVRQNHHPLITYCINCRSVFASVGKPVLHILDLLFGLHDVHRKTPTHTGRRENRIYLKQRLLKQFGIDQQGSGKFMEESGPKKKILLKVPSRMKEVLNQK